MVNEEKTPSPPVVLDRNEWVAFIADMRKIIQAYEALVNRGVAQKMHKGVGVQKKSLGSSIRVFLGLKQKATSRPPNSYYNLVCPYCGTDREIRDKFCRICGRNVYSPNQD